ncbi:hypothetical protein [Alkalicoccus urumqiensis]|uniref:DUF8042 domain-containing protein n=1 Tax=Alkalicoccus urumqiensis TaxID=1548213 RepID=A0A2P6MHB8_ALKUR|nr:hypothetical protein [Alkalicoccus urumqiensis]PRO65640.1 hypothetical protein C6I21_08950 [Alkalicoccus urumqiensis]
MEKQIPVMTQSLSLVRTLEDAAGHIQHQLAEGELNDTFYLVEDLLSGFTAVQEALQPLDQEILDLSGVITASDDVQQALAQLVEAYEKKDHQEAQEQTRTTLAPRLTKLRAEMEEAFQSYTTQ